MANEQNLTHKLTVSDQRKGGKKSGEVRRNKKTVQKILDELLQRPAADIPQLKKLMEKHGMSLDKSVKELFALIAMLNTLKTASLGDLGELAALLGEDIIKSGADTGQDIDPLTKSLMEEAERMSNANKP